MQRAPPSQKTNQEYAAHDRFREIRAILRVDIKLSDNDGRASLAGRQNMMSQDSLAAVWTCARLTTCTQYLAPEDSVRCIMMYISFQASLQRCCWANLNVDDARSWYKL